MAAAPPNLGTKSPAKPAHGDFFAWRFSLSLLSVRSLNFNVFLLITGVILFTEAIMLARLHP
jgi:hypothetical protein